MSNVTFQGNAKFQGKTFFNLTSATLFNSASATLPTYTIGRSLSAVNEGSSVTFTLSTTNVANGTFVPYTISGISSSDLRSGSLSGNFTVLNNLATAIVALKADNLTEGNEIATLTLNNSAASNFVLVKDTSTRSLSSISGI